MTNIKIKKLDNSEVEIEGEIPAEGLANFRGEAIKNLGQNVEIDGFRKGHVPENVLVQKIGEERILLEMAELALSANYPTIVKDNNLDAIGQPEITITKLAAGNPLGFKIKTAVMPVIQIGDYKKIAKKVNGEKEEPTEATDKEVDQVIDEVKRARAKTEKDADGKETVALPELTDEFVKMLGDFASVADFKEKIKHNLGEEKKYKARDKKRLKIMDEIIAKTEIALPEILIAGELHKMLGEMRAQIEQAGLEFEKYLEHVKKTVETIKEEWRPEAIKHVKFGLILNKIAGEEKIEVPHDEIHPKQEEILSRYKDLDPRRVHDYVEDMLRSEKVLKFLEEQK